MKRKSQSQFQYQFLMKQKRDKHLLKYLLDKCQIRVCFIKIYAFQMIDFFYLDENYAEDFDESDDTETSKHDNSSETNGNKLKTERIAVDVRFCFYLEVDQNNIFRKHSRNLFSLKCFKMIKVFLIGLLFSLQLIY